MPNENNCEKKGSLVVVGCGINVAAHLTDCARTNIARADIVFAAQACPTGMHVIRSLNSNVVDLGELYQEGKSRVTTYRQMVEVIAEAVCQGKTVCGAFYGHPGIFVYAGHKVIKLLQRQGYVASMMPGISAEDCLVADLGIDPGVNGVQALDVNQYLFYRHSINPHCLLILWQFGLTGDIHFDSQQADKFYDGLAILKDELLAIYPGQHQVILYEASTLAIEPARIERMALTHLDRCRPTALSTLVIPSMGVPQYDHRVMARFGITAAQLEKNLDGLLDD